MLEQTSMNNNSREAREAKNMTRMDFYFASNAYEQPDPYIPDDDDGPGFDTLEEAEGER